MTSPVALRAPRAAARRARTAAAIAVHGFDRLWLGAALCGLAFGATAASSATTYVGSFPTALDRHQLAVTTGRDAGLSVLLGPVSAIGTVGGYTVYKGFVFLTVVGSLWALLTATRLLRGEEDAGRWQLVLAGGTRPAVATLATLAALAAGVAVVLAATVAITLLAARNPDVGFSTRATLFYGVTIATAPAVFGAVGALTSQLGRTRRAASGLGLVVFGTSFVLRMVADAGHATRWLLWATPFGWVERMRPLTASDPWPLVPAACAVAGAGLAAVVLAARRDAGAGVVAARDVAAPRPFGLGSPLGLAARRELPVLAAWWAGAFAAGVMLDLIAKVTSAASPASLHDTLHKLGVHGSFAKQYFGVAFLLVATMVALVPAGQVGAAADEETDGRLVHVLAGPVGRTTWLAGRLALAGAGVVAAGVLAGAGAWIGARSQGVHIGAATLLGAGLNVVPVALVALGAGAVVLAFAPRRAAVAVYALVAWSLVVDLTASLVTGLGWLRRLTLFHYMALAPAERAGFGALAATTGAALVLAALAVARFRTRDLEAG